jgi:ERCC4-type nuclease
VPDKNEIRHEVGAILWRIWVDACPHVNPASIFADVGENRSGVPDILRDLGAEVVVESLPAGDYVVAQASLVERKTVADLHRSIATGRLWRQLEKLRTHGDRAWLLVEGPRLDGQVSAEGIRGAVLAVIETGIPVVWSGSARDSALWLRRLAARGSVSSAWVMRAPRGRSTPTPARILSEIPGISPRLAARLLERFASVAAVASASKQELMSIEGIGEVRAANLRMLLSGTSSSGTSRDSEKCPDARSVVEQGDPGWLSPPPARVGRCRGT